MNLLGDKGNYHEVIKDPPTTIKDPPTTIKGKIGLIKIIIKDPPTIIKDLLTTIKDPHTIIKDQIKDPPTIIKEIADLIIIDLSTNNLSFSNLSETFNFAENLFVFMF